MSQRVWQLQEAKNKLSQVVDEAIQHGPQIITRHGVEAVVVLSYSEYAHRKQAQGKLSDFFRQSPLAEIVLERDRSPARNGVEL